MGIIQSAVNQTLGTVGIAARLSPDYETKQELHKLKKEEKATNLQLKELENVSLEDRTAQAKLKSDAIQKQAEIAQRQFELKPSKKSFSKARDLRSTAYGEPVSVWQDDEIAMEQAQLKAESKQNLKAEQDKKMTDFQKKFMEDVITMRTRKEEVK